MKAYPNLLPEEKGKEIEIKRVSWLIAGQCARLVLVVLIFAGTLFSFNIILKIKLSALENVHSLEQAQEKFQEVGKYEKKFRETNIRTAQLSKIQSEHLYWSKTLRELSKIIFDGVSITSLATENYKISLAGKTRTRDDLIRLQDKINSSDCFDGAEAPVSSLALKENVDFLMEFDLNENCLKR